MSSSESYSDVVFEEVSSILLYQVSTNRDSLRCTVCQGACPVCSDHCCVYSKARNELEKTSPSDSDAQENAQAILNEINQLIAVGKDEPTFLECTECHKLVCPECCGVCPVLLCSDRTCVVCNVDSWMKCNWHE